MRLFVQLIIMVTIFTTILATSIVVQNFNNSKEYIQNQLYTDAVNTSHWLGFSLSIPSIVQLPVMESLINAAYDSGYYEEIRLLDINGTILYSRQDKKNIYNVPEWFINFIELKNEVASSDIIIDWQRFGTIEVRGHTDFAYHQLYNAFLYFVNIFLVTVTVGCFILYFLLHFSLRPLKRMQEQAEGIKENKFIIQEKLPFTTEFRSVAVAINSMIMKVKDIFERDSEILQEYQAVLYKDTETKIYNRKYLLIKLPDYLQDNSALGSGTYVMFSMEGLNRLKREHGYERYHKVLTFFIDDVQQAFDHVEDLLFVRLNINDFMLIVPSYHTLEVDEKLQIVLDKLRNRVNALDPDIEEYFKVGCGIGNYTPQDDMKRLLTRADNNVMLAKVEENFHAHIDQTDENTLVMGKEELREELLNAIEESRLLLISQPVMRLINDKQTLFHEKVFLRLFDSQGNEQRLNFTPMAIGIGISNKLDRYLMEQIFAAIHESRFQKDIAVTLGIDFIKNSSHFNWLVDQLALLNKAKTGHKICFNVSNNIAIHEVEAINEFALMIKSLGHMFAIDYFVLPQTTPVYLQILRPDFLRINTSYIFDMIYGDTPGHMRSSLLNIVNSIGTDIIATHINSTSDFDKLHQIKINYFQGAALSSTYQV